MSYIKANHASIDAAGNITIHTAQDEEISRGSLMVAAQAERFAGVIIADGHARGGKTSEMIDKLMEPLRKENERLKAELKEKNYLMKLGAEHGREMLAKQELWEAENVRLNAEVERLQNAFELLRSGRVTPEFFSS